MAPSMTARHRLEAAGSPGPREPLDSHRIALHLSPATDTACSTTGYRAIRVRGDIDIVAANTWDGFDAKSGYASLEVLLSPGLLAGVAQEAGLPAHFAQLQTAHLLRDARLQSLLFALDADLRSASPYGDLFRESLELSLATALLLRGPAHAPEAPSPVSTHALERVAEYIAANLDKTLTLARLASIAGVSRSSLQRAFKRWCGLAVHQYVVHRRVERAQALILQGRESMSDIAAMAGFAHQSHMARWMRRIQQQAPAG